MDGGKDDAVELAGLPHLEERTHRVSKREYMARPGEIVRSRLHIVCARSTQQLASMLLCLEM